jgi:hypothetical protein
MLRQARLVVLPRAQARQAGLFGSGDASRIVARQGRRGLVRSVAYRLGRERRGEAGA